MFSDLLINWYLLHKRDLPWRNITDPYRIWVSEIILQQTRVAQGLSYYMRFMERFPTVVDLAEATEDEVLKYWQGLGYYSRARNLHAAAKQIAFDRQGSFPSRYEEVRALKGVGDYTAAAICSFAFGLPCAVVDGNVYRVLSRCFAVDVPIDSTRGKRFFSDLARELLDSCRPALHNQALMDLGAMVCLPASPCCEGCPLSSICQACSEGTVARFPVKEKRVRQRDRYFLYLYIKEGEKTYLHRRGKGDIWQGLYEFPLVELTKPFAEDVIDESLLNPLSKELSKEFANITILRTHPVVKHVLSHQNIHALFVEAEARYLAPSDSHFIEIPLSKIDEYAVSRLTEMFLQRKEG